MSNETVVGTYQVAAALGHPLPAPPKTLVATVSVISHGGSGSLYELASFTRGTREEALIDLAEWVIEVWEDSVAPWEPGDPDCSNEEWERLRDKYLANKSPKDVVEEYFDRRGYKRETGDDTVVRYFIRETLIEEATPWANKKA